MKKIQTYLAFDRPLEIGCIRTTFASTHSQQQKIILGWGTDSTRQKLISAYWFKHVVGHFMAMFGIAMFVALLFHHRIDRFFLLPVLIVGMFSFLVLLISHYLPNFTADFLPKLNAIRTGYEALQQQELIAHLREQISSQQEQIALQQQMFQRDLHEQSVKQQEVFHVELQHKLADQETRMMKQQERTQRHFQDQVAVQKALVEQQQEEIRKCRQMQLSNFALTLVYYAWAKVSGLNIEGSDQTAQLLQRLYGVDRGSLRNNLEMISGTSSKRKNLGDRKITEMRNRFEEAIHFCKDMEYPKGISVLKELEIKILGN
ncbi:hypothetical protein ACX0G9_23075 [Flavitalea flava]